MERTLVLLKPDCVQRRLMGQVITRLENGDYLLGDARYYAVEDGRFSVVLPDGLCSEPGAN